MYADAPDADPAVDHHYQLGQQDPSDDDGAATCEVGSWSQLRVREVELKEIHLDADAVMEAGSFHAVCRDNDIVGARLLLDNDADVTARDEREETALHFAASAAMVRLLTEEGASVHACDMFGRTPLFRAVRLGRADAVQELISAGADVHATDAFGQTAMFQINVLGDSVAAFEVLVNHGASVQIPSVFMDTPLHRAAMYGKLNSVEFLLDHGAPIDASMECQTPLYEAAANGRLDIVKLLLERGASVYGDPALPNFPVLTAALYGELSIIAELLVKGAWFHFEETAPEDIASSGIVPTPIQVLELMIDNCESIMPASSAASNLAFKTWYWSLLDKLNDVALELQPQWIPAMQMLRDVAYLIPDGGCASSHDISVRYGSILLRFWKWTLEYAERKAADGEHPPQSGEDGSLEDLDAISKFQREVGRFQTVLQELPEDADDWDDDEVFELLRVLDFPERTRSEEIDMLKASVLSWIRDSNSDKNRTEHAEPDRDVWAKLHNAALELSALHEHDAIHGELAPKGIQRVSSDDGGEGESAGVNTASEQEDPEAVRWKSPESLKGAADSYATDVYSFGMCILEAASGHVPWGEVSSGVVSVLMGLGRLPKRPETMTDEQWQLVVSLCAKDPAHRPEMGAVIEKLDLIAAQAQQTRVAEAMDALIHRRPIKW